MKQFIRLIFLFLTIAPLSNCFCQTSTQNKELAKLYIDECLNRRKIEIVDEIFADSFKIHTLLDSSENSSNRKDLKDFLRTLFDAFPDIHYKIGDIISEGDKVVMRVSFNATHRKEFLGIHANGNKIDYISEILFFRFENGKIVEDWVQLDLYNLFKKLKGEQ
jgi:steroid delta-isomerase-like uncharacterized protein